MSREYASGRMGISSTILMRMNRAPAHVQRAINRSRAARGLEAIQFDSGAERLADARSRGAAALARLRAVLPRSLW